MKNMVFCFFVWLAITAICSQSVVAQSSTRFDYLDDIFEPPAQAPAPSNPEPTTQEARPSSPGGALPGGGESGEPTQRNSSLPPQSTFSLGEPTYRDTGLDQTVVSIEPQRFVDDGSLQVSFVDSTGQPAAGVEVRFVSTDIKITSDDSGTVIIEDIPESSEILLQSTAHTGDYVPMFHQVRAPTFADNWQFRQSGEEQISIQLVQVRSGVLAGWLADLNLEDDPRKGQLCGAVSSSGEDASGYRVRIVDPLDHLRIGVSAENTSSTYEFTSRHRVYYLGEDGSVDRGLTATGPSGKYCLFHLSPGRYEVHIGTKLNRHGHSLVHQTTIQPAHMTYLSSFDTYGKVGLIRFVVAPPADRLLNLGPQLELALPLRDDDAYSSWSPASIINVFEGLYQGIWRQSDLKELIALREDRVSLTDQDNQPSRGVMGLVQAFLTRWWDDTSRAGRLPPSASLLPQIFAPTDDQIVHVKVRHSMWEPTIHRLSESVWYGIYPMMLLRKGTLAEVAKLGGIYYNPTASHVFIEHRLRSDETQIRLVQEFWSDDGELLVADLVRRSPYLLRSVYVNLEQGRYFWVLKTVGGRWLTSRIITTEDSSVSVVQSGRMYQLGESLPFRGKSLLEELARARTSTHQRPLELQNVIPVP